ncbi:MAG: translation elongation factor 4 [Caldilineaceae bacterium]|nr:translation elongation factor 4 [Caldilineaceae bacterium]MCY4089284.1 translation elongation factor 4 [Caldilineaceae bacterium]MDE0068347.1 translation elongation factor 4 [Caldilineaceae bacterium]MDE0183451.1 translation elongation factor 4 [Caldilineaceae bacterium]MDE0428609.1 translation elongation factor 4 [Caldilineaceae bacterium]
MDLDHIRNFCIIAHIDHGKSTLADRLIQLTGTVTDREMKEQLLDSMDLEREKGVTIKASAVRMIYRRRRPGEPSADYEMNLIDTPGHVDFTYEVKRALQACEGAVLVVDASQGIQAQTVAHLLAAMELDLTIIPVLNKIDLAAAMPDEVAQDIEDLLAVPAADILRISAKDDLNIENVLESIVEQVPPPQGNTDARLQALVFDCHYDPYKGVVAYVRVVNGALTAPARLLAISGDKHIDPIEIGILTPAPVKASRLEAGEVGYIATGLKSVQDLDVGDTITLASDPAPQPLPGYEPMKPMVFAGLYPTDSDDYHDLRDALEKLHLNDGALTFEPETSQALGFGFRLGFLGLFHMEIVQERLEREYDLDIIFTAPSVAYRVIATDGSQFLLESPADLPDASLIEQIEEPWCGLQIYAPSAYIGPILEMVTKRRGRVKNQLWLDTKRVELSFQIPLAEIIVDFYNELKARTRGYASMDYTLDDYQPSDMVKLDVLVNGQPVDALSIITHRDDAYPKGQRMVSKMKDIIPRQLFTVPIQAAIGNKVISRANVKALRKDVLSKCYGGDVTRKRKLLENQKAGKKRMKMVGAVEIPQEAFMTVLSLEDE